MSQLYVWHIMNAYKQNYYIGTGEFWQAVQGQMTLRSSGKPGIAWWGNGAVEFEIAKGTFLNVSQSGFLEVRIKQ